MNYYYDTEFLEGTQRKRFFGIPYGKTKPTIDLISIGIVDEDGRTYYVISKDFNLKEAWNRYDLKTNDNYDPSKEDIYYNPMYIKEYWIRENVLKPIFEDLTCGLYNKDDYKFTYWDMKFLLRHYGKSNKVISEEVFNFVNPDLGYHVAAYNNSEFRDPESKMSKHFEKHNVTAVDEVYVAQPTFYGYYSAYDHVVFCWMFGKMINLPAGFPMYTKDLQQMLDEKPAIWNTSTHVVDGELSEGCLPGTSTWKDHPSYPEQLSGHHSAIHDARWHKELHEFIIKHCK